MIIAKRWKHAKRVSCSLEGKGRMKLCNKELQNQFLRFMQEFQKIHLERMVPEVSKMEFITLQQIFSLQGKSEREEGIYVADLIKRMDTHPSAMSRLLKGLEEKGYIQRETDKKNRRNTLVCVSEQGKQKCTQIRQRMEKYMDGVFQKMGEEKVIELFHLWEQLLICMNEELANVPSMQELI